MMKTEELPTQHPAASEHLLMAYIKLARREEQQALVSFGDSYRAYLAKTPSWWPNPTLK
jgi:protein-S-isoprenylcysteine O-methyltransferase Ste14